MKFLIPSTLTLLLSTAVARAESTPKSLDPKPTGETSHDTGEADPATTQEKTPSNGEADKADSKVAPMELPPLPFGAAYSFGVTRKKEGATDLQSAGFARLEVFKSMAESIAFFKNMTIGLSYSAADIGGILENKGGYRGTLTSFGLNVSGFSSKRGNWRSKTGTSLEISKLKRLPSFKYGNSNVEVSYKPSISLSQAGYYTLNEGLSIGPAVAVQMGGITGWTLGFEALFAF